MRLSREEYYFKVVMAVAERSTCDRGKVGAILVKDGRIISTGYAGAPAGMPHCDEVGHEFQKRRMAHGMKFESKHCIRTVHAELNAILQAAKFGVAVNGADLYCKVFPCYDCAKAIVNVGIKKVYAWFAYQQMDAPANLLVDAGIDFKVMDHGSVEEPSE